MYIPVKELPAPTISVGNPVVRITILSVVGIPDADLVKVVPPPAPPPSILISTFLSDPDPDTRKVFPVPTKLSIVTPVPAIAVPPDCIPIVPKVWTALCANFAVVTDPSAGTDTPIDVPNTIIKQPSPFAGAAENSI